MIIHDSKSIYILHKQSCQFEHTGYTPELYFILCKPSICSYSYDYHKKRIAVEIMLQQRNGKRWKNLLGRFLYFWINNERPTEVFLRDLPIDRTLSVDHINGDRGNHSFWNLSGITKSANSRKGEYASRIKPPYYCYAVVDSDSKYRVCFGYRNPWWQGQEMCIMCDTIDLLIHFYKSLMEISNAPAFLSRGETPFLLWKADKKKGTAMEDWKKARDYADYLLGLTDSDFEHWTENSYITTRFPFRKL